MVRNVEDLCSESNITPDYANPHCISAQIQPISLRTTMANHKRILGSILVNLSMFTEDSISKEAVQTLEAPVFVLWVDPVGMAYKSERVHEGLIIAMHAKDPLTFHWYTMLLGYMCSQQLLSFEAVVALVALLLAVCVKDFVVFPHLLQILENYPIQT